MFRKDIRKKLSASFISIHVLFGVLIFLLIPSIGAQDKISTCLNCTRAGALFCSNSLLCYPNASACAGMCQGGDCVASTAQCNASCYLCTATGNFFCKAVGPQGTCYNQLQACTTDCGSSDSCFTPITGCTVRLSCEDCVLPQGGYQGTWCPKDMRCYQSSGLCSSHCDVPCSRSLSECPSCELTGYLKPLECSISNFMTVIVAVAAAVSLCVAMFWMARQYLQRTASLEEMRLASLGEDDGIITSENVNAPVS